MFLGLIAFLVLIESLGLISSLELLLILFKSVLFVLVLCNKISFVLDNFYCHNQNTAIYPYALRL